MKILVADEVSPDGIAEMKKMGHNILYLPKATEPEFIKAMGEFQPVLLLVRSRKVAKESIDADPHLEFVIRAGAGYDTIDVAYCSCKGIYVSNCPGKI